MSPTLAKEGDVVLFDAIVALQLDIKLSSVKGAAEIPKILDDTVSSI